MIKLNTPIHILLISFVFLFGCQEESRREAGTDAAAKESLAEAAVEQTEPAKEMEEVEEVQQAIAEPEVITEPAKEISKQAEPSEENEKAKKKLLFAQNRLSLAQKGIIGYSQTVALCRDVMKECPGTEYERQAKELLRKVPESQRTQYKITNEELEL